MNSPTDQQLLREYTTHRSEAAFAELVRRRLDFVYSAALRMVCDPHLAQDVAQGVFVALAKNADRLARHPVLFGWLHRTTQNLAANVVRTEVRRRNREQEAVAMNQLLANESGATWEMLAPHLDALLGELDETDRDALLLRYFERKSAREMAGLLGLSEDAAQKRVSRAVERLRESFSKRHLAIGAGALTVLISANAVQSAPVGLAAAILRAALIATPTLGITMLHKILIAGMTAVVAGAGIYTIHLQHQINSFQQQDASLQNQVGQLQQQYHDATDRVASLEDENKQLKADHEELLRLRSEVTRTQQSQNLPASQNLSDTNNAPQSPEQSIRVKSEFVFIPAEDIQTLGVVWKSGPQPGTLTGLLDEEQFKEINEALQGASDVNIMNSPQVITPSGGSGDVGTSRSVAVGDTNANAGIDLAVSPRYSQDSSLFDLDVHAKLKLLTGDLAQPDLQTLDLTNVITLSPGQTAVLTAEIPSGAWLFDPTNIPTGSRSLVVFITPKIVNARDYIHGNQRIVSGFGSPTNADISPYPQAQ